ncbi:hypothetical protein CPB84DRAFT_1333713 [Gymnopilus junonius]|uniref:Uncharacterized protein n=1 Tax=Gymnopilus junonius TaxID=109634 RepID=A0A9P5NHQ9_GYMJU|nr:hypothetical protein CPB84DRAFT_1333713 [Gymnopilus junonius]
MRSVSVAACRLTLVRSDGLYRYSPDLAAPNEPARPPVHVWFSHNLITGHGSTYLIHQCPANPKQLILSCAQGPNFRSLLRPLAIDIFLGEDSVQKWAERVAETRMNLLKYEGPLPKELDHETTAKSVEDLYQLSQLFQIIRDIVADIRDELDFLVTVFEQRESKVPWQNLDDASVAESLRFVRSKNQILMRWVINYTERTQVQINRFFNHATQKDNAVNVSISKLTSKIAVSAQKDSSAMITYALLVLTCEVLIFISEWQL